MNAEGRYGGGRVGKKARREKTSCVPRPCLVPFSFRLKRLSFERKTDCRPSTVFFIMLFFYSYVVFIVLHRTRCSYFLYHVIFIVMSCNSTHTYVVCDQDQQKHSCNQTCPSHDNDGAKLCEEELSGFTEKVMGMKYCKPLNSLHMVTFSISLVQIHTKGGSKIHKQLPKLILSKKFLGGRFAFQSGTW